MALLLADSCGDHYTTAQAARKWTLSGATASAVVVADVAGTPGGGNCLRFNTNTGGVYATRSLNGATPATVVVGGWINYASVTDLEIFLLLDGATLQLDVVATAAGLLQVRRGGSVTLGTSAGSMSAGWHHVELKTTINNTTGTAELRVDGVAVVGPLTAQNTRASANNQVTQLRIGAKDNRSLTYKSVYVLDTTGSYGNDWIGPGARVSVHRPVGVGATAAWTPVNAPSGYAAVIDPAGPTDDDLTWVQTSTANNINTYPIQDAPSSGATIHGIQHVLAVKTDGGSRTIAAVERWSGTDYPLASKTVAGGWTYIVDPRSVKGDGGGGNYTPAGIAAMEAGHKLVS